MPISLWHRFPDLDFNYDNAVLTVRMHATALYQNEEPSSSMPLPKVFPVFARERITFIVESEESQGIMTKTLHKYLEDVCNTPPTYGTFWC
jgi:hypothetical protein